MRFHTFCSILISVCIVLAMLTGCGADQEDPSAEGSSFESPVPTEEPAPTPTPTPTPTPKSSPSASSSPTPTPTPPPSVEGINIQCFGTDVKDEFTLSLSRDAAGITLQATVLPMEVFTAENTNIKWTSSDESLFIVTPSEDTRSCKVEILQTSATPGTLTISCNDYTMTLTVRLVG